MRHALIALVLLLGACPKDTTVNESEKITATPKTNEVTLVGVKAVMIMQSPVSPSFSPDGKEPEMWYLDVEGGGQVTLYSEKAPDCQGKIEVVGTPREVTASKGGEDQTFTQYDVTRWKCL
jgi:hypothetical protein